ncbi:MAG: leucine-rich repeat domain-containing protein, partial [Dysgonamonadaceae bacterium]|nr:leucine-rich repeat domain-containing protein [Dysgonamonadaceae bacterium]
MHFPVTPENVPESDLRFPVTPENVPEFYLRFPVTPENVPEFHLRFPVTPESVPEFYFRFPVTPENVPEFYLRFPVTPESVPEFYLRFPVTPENVPALTFALSGKPERVKAHCFLAYETILFQVEYINRIKIKVMKNNFFVMMITALVLFGSAEVRALDIIITDHTAGNLATEISAELSGQITDIASLTISGGTLDAADATAIKACTNLETLDISGVVFASNTLTGSLCFVNTSVTPAPLPLPVQTVILPNTLTVINTAAFRNCKSLTSVKVKMQDGSTVDFFSNAYVNANLAIEGQAFFDCTQLLISELPSVRYIRDQAFGNTQITISAIPE